jgi:hypothetical protein
MFRVMLARLILLLVALPTMALAAGAPLGDALPADGPVFVPKPKPAASSAMTPAPAAQPAALQSRAPPVVDPSACRMACAQTYYFCSADDEGQGCGQSWSQCVSTCNSPSLDPNAAPAP